MREPMAFGADAALQRAQPNCGRPREQRRSADAALRIVARLLDGISPLPGVLLWDGTRRPGEVGSAFTLVVRDPAALRRLVFRRDPLLLADAYIDGTLDVEGDLYAALGLKDRMRSLGPSLRWRHRLELLRDALRLAPARAAQAGARAFDHAHSRESDHRAVSFHYDLSNDFYGLWLDREHVYSCAYYESPDDSLDEAQCRKLEHICRKLRLRPGEHFLDVGCGWGALVLWAARHHGVTAHGITLSERQKSFSDERIRAEGLQDRVTVELLDYRDLPADGRYDKIASVGMFEHVGLARMPAYLKAVHGALRPGGLFLNHGITHDEEGWNDTLARRFINRHVFPDGELDRVSNIQLGMERAGFEIHDVEGLRPHYALTLREWVRRLDAAQASANAWVGDATWRTWRLYMAACALEFEAGDTSIHQIPASRRSRGIWPVPLTRQDLYAQAPGAQDGPAPDGVDA